MLSKDYILGFVEGEGCFSITIQRYVDRKPRKTKTRCKKKYPYLFRVNPTFRITQVIDDGCDVLKEVKETLGFGCFQIQRRSLADGNSRDVVHYYAQGLNECFRVKEFFTSLEFKTSKGKSFEKWCRVLDLMEEGKHLTREGLLEICDIRGGMNYRKSKCKWTKEEIIKVLDAKPIHQTAHFDPEQEKLIHNNNLDMFEYLKLRQGNRKKSALVPEPVESI